MREPSGKLRKILLGVFRPSSIPAAVAFVIVVAAGLYADNQNRAIFEQGLRADVLHRVSLIRAKLEGNINANLQLVRGLVSTLATEPDMDQARFSALVGKLVSEASQLRHIAAAPDLVVRLIHPLKGNESALGLDYRNNAAQREAALRVRDTGRLVVAGPVDLVQGGRGFIGRFPVFLSDGTPRDRFWGIVAAVVDVEQLYADSGLLDPELPIEVAISGKDALGEDGGRFHGPAAVTRSDPVTVDVLLPSGSWQLSAIPKGGWDVTPPHAWLMRLLMVIGGALIVVPMAISGRLVDERQRYIGELRSREAQLERVSRRLGLALDTSRVGVWEFNIDSGLLVWDDRMNELYGLPTDGGPRGYQHWKESLHPEDFERAEADFAEAIDSTGRYNSEYRLLLPDGAIRHIRAIGAVYDEIDGSRMIVGVNWDVSDDVTLNESLQQANEAKEARNAELEMAKESIEHNALHDSLTGLPNRRYLDQMLATHGPDTPIALLHIDLDRFKQINDTLGHAAGDAMLVHAAKVLKQNLRPGDFVARVGGDEFVVMSVMQAGGEADALLGTLADRIIAEMRQPVLYRGHECRCGVSVGIASQSDSADDARQLLVNADIALYRAKNRGRNRYQFFNRALQAEIVSTKRTADEVLSGLESDQFVAYYQPQFDARTREIIGVEALARWNHPVEGLLAPQRFLKIAEELNVVDTLDRAILEQALRDLGRWEKAGLEIPQVSVNVSARRLQDEELVKSLNGLAIAPGKLSFELVESIFLDENDDVVSWNVDQVKELGIGIEIDDFGTGYASIVSLMKLKPQRLKIDRQLVKPIVRSTAQRQLVQSIIEIGKSLGIKVLAEGVETPDHAGILESLGCHALQGYAFARPMSAEELVKFVRSRRWLEAS